MLVMLYEMNYYYSSVHKRRSSIAEDAVEEEVAFLVDVFVVASDVVDVAVAATVAAVFD